MMCRGWVFPWVTGFLSSKSYAIFGGTLTASWGSHQRLHHGNTVIVIEHSLDMIAQADWIIDIGPGAGRYGGNLVFEGTVHELLEHKTSATARYLKKHLE
jgi:hypothetical protein